MIAIERKTHIANAASETTNAASNAGKDEVQIGLGDVPSEEFRAQLHKIADWIADYRASIEHRTISPNILPGQITAQLPDAPPAQPENIDRIFADFEKLIVPNLVHWGHPAFLGYFGSTTTAPGIYGEMLMAALNVSAMTWRTSPAATELEIVVLDWIRQMIELPQEFEGIVYDTASVGIMHALAAARESLGLNVRREGLAGRAPDAVPRLILYASDQAHSSIEKAAIALGIGEANVRRIRSDENYCLKIEELRAAITEDLRAGFRPLAVVATVGTTSATSVDPVREIAHVCREHNLWLHVDAAYGAALALLPEGRWVMDGVAEADSVIVNPHKWLFVPLDFSVLYTRRLDILRATFSLTPEYLQGDAAAGSKHENAARAGRNYMDYGIQLGRRFRALKAWMVFRTFGREGLEARIREHCRLAALFASWVEADADFEVLAPVKMAVVCFRVRAKDFAMNESLNELNQTLVERINRTGKAYLTHTRLHGKVVARLAVGNVLTTEKHLAETLTLLRNELARLRHDTTS